MNAILETPRLILREMSLDDLDFVAAMLADDEVMRFYPQTYNRDESVTWIERQCQRYDEHGIGFWLALDRRTKEPIGQIGLLPHWIEETLEPGIGYMIHRPYWRSGYAAEGARACRDHAFQVRREPVVICLVRPENTPSRGVAQKIGLSLDEQRRVTLAGFDHLVYFARADASEPPRHERGNIH